MKIGFTGTQRGMTAPQRTSFTAALLFARIGLNPEFHHGDCIGADAEAHAIAIGLGFRAFIHPPIDPKKRAWCEASWLFEPKPYLDRNHDIVDAAQFLIAAPGEPIEQLRSGTWATIRYARKINRNLLIIGPKGLPL